MRPFDPRLLRHVPAIRRDVALLAVLGAATAISIVVAAFGLAHALASLPRVDTRSLATFGLALTVRVGLTALSGVVAARIAALVKSQLRADLVRAAGARGPAWLAGQKAGELATLTGRGLDALDGYFAGYLPQLILGVTVPVAVLVTLATADIASAVIVLVTLPLIPIFGVLIGWQTRAATEKQWHRLSLLGGHFLDVVTGLPTLKAFGRARSQVDAVREMASRHRVATMRTLRIAFLSALVLELVGTISVALVAVPIGLRLMSGGLTLTTALLVLLLTPEAYAPLRAAGTRFHASMEGLTALDQAFTLLSGAAHPSGSLRVTGFREITFESVSVRYDRGVALSDVDLTIAAGDRVALVGPSGGGKSTLIGLVLGFVTPTSGRVLVDGVDLSTMDLAAWRAQLAWVPQRPHMFAGTLSSNIAMGATVPHARVADAARAASLPHDLSLRLGENGVGLSNGERQRVALARAFLRSAPLLLLDEPTARLDHQNEAAIVAATLELARSRTAVLVAHRPALLDIATRIIRVADGIVSEVDDAQLDNDPIAEAAA